MIDYYEQLTQEEKEEVTDVIQTLYRQTFLLERKFDKRAERMQYTKEYRTCTKHLEFFKAYFEVAGIILRESVSISRESSYGVRSCRVWRQSIYWC